MRKYLLIALLFFTASFGQFKLNYSGSEINYRLLLAGDSLGTGALTQLHQHYISGINGLQAILDLKATLASPTFTGTVTFPTPFTLGSTSVTATGTEINYLVGVSSALQTQLNNKQASNAGLTSLAALSYSAAAYVRTTGTDTYDLRTYANVKTDLSLNNVENIALTTWTGSSSITTLGTIGTGGWAASVIGDAYTTKVHNNTTSLQGGTSAQYYHLTSAQHTIATQAATTSLSGYLTDTDWDTFNGKQAGNANLTSLAALTYASDAFIKMTGANTFAVRTIAETKSDLSLNLVENIGVSTYAGTTSTTTLGTIGTGTWNATSIADGKFVKTGDWTGTFDNQEGSYYLNLANLSGALTATGGTFTGDVSLKGTFDVYDSDSDDQIFKITRSGDDGILQLYQNNNIVITMPAGVNQATTFNTGGNFGIGTITPTSLDAGITQEISSATGAEVILTRDASLSTGSEIIGGLGFKSTDTSGDDPHYIGIKARANGVAGIMDLEFYSGIGNYELNTPQMVLNKNNNLGLGTLAFGTNATNTFAQHVGVAPSTFPSDQIQAWVDTTGGTAEWKAADSDGNISALTANTNSYPKDMAVSDTYAYVIPKENPYLGVKTFISNNKALEILQEWAWETGRLDSNKYIIKHTQIAKRDWEADQETFYKNRQAKIDEWQKAKDKSIKEAKPFNQVKPKTYIKRAKPRWLMRKKNN